MDPRRAGEGANWLGWGWRVTLGGQAGTRNSQEGPFTGGGGEGKLISITNHLLFFVCFYIYAVVKAINEEILSLCLEVL